MGKREFVRRSFASIAGSYDPLNTLLSFGADTWWRRQAVKGLTLSQSGLVLDACAGTMRLGKDLLRRWPQVRVVALDFSLEMLGRGARRARHASIAPVCGDAEELPFQDRAFAGVIVGFGLRNLADPQRGIEELFRVLKQEGRAVVLEFGRPSFPIFKNIYQWYLSQVIPWAGGFFSRHKEVYRYLHDSIMVFYEPEELMAMMQKVGFSQVSYRRLTGGIANLYIGEKIPHQ